VSKVKGAEVMLDVSIVGKKFEPTVFEYTWKDVVLYALGIGAQADELPFVYQDSPAGLKVFPSYGVILSGNSYRDILAAMKVDLSRFIHGEHLVRLHRPIPPHGKIVTVGEVTSIYDKGKAALITFRMETTTDEGEPLCDDEAVIYYRGEGGFGGDPGPKTDPAVVPEGVEPAFCVSYAIPENQAALYRLNGDLNPLHIDPDFAKRGGYDRPILHGLCTFGYATRAVLYSLCDGDVDRFKEIKARFSGVVYPGETLVTEGWREHHGRYLIQARTQRGVVLNQAYAVVA
jgi:acyl dehydratase